MIHYMPHAVAFIFGVICFVSGPTTSIANEDPSQPSGLSLAVSEEFLQTFLTAEYHGQDVSTEKDQAFGFDQVGLRIKKEKITLSTNFWYKKFLTKAKKTPLIDVAGFLKASFSTQYIAKKKRIMLANSSIDELDLRKGAALKPLLIPLLSQAINRVIVWKKINNIALGDYAEIPVNQVKVDLREKSVVVHLNQPSLVPEELLQEMFVISANESMINIALEAITPYMFPEFHGTLEGYTIELAKKPFMDIFPGPSVKQGEMQLHLPLLLIPGESQKKQSPLPLTLLLGVTPHLEGQEKQVSMRLELDTSFQFSETDSSPPASIQQALQAYVVQAQQVLSQLKLEIPPIQFIREKQALQLSKVVLDNDQLGLGATLVNIE
ncbi:MAG: hypothetical protein HQM14_14620 [SAR324 cluster bacterium]|nr:hypothetical protein [SAR324 cluster bacterium]